MDSSQPIIGSAPSSLGGASSSSIYASLRSRSVSESDGPDIACEGTRILLIDDLESVHLMTVRLCKTRFKWDVTSARTAQEGGLLALSEVYDVILLDFNLDGKNKGNQVARKIRDATVKVLIYSYSNGAVADEKYQGKKLWDGHLDKTDIPAALEELRKILVSRSVQESIPKG